MSSAEQDEPPSPLLAPQELPPVLAQALLKETVKVDVACPRPGEDVTIADEGDGPVFRATIKALEQKTGNMRVQMKRVLKKAEQAHIAQVEAN